MGSWLSEREQRLVAGAETASAPTPIPTQIVSNGEYFPPSQSETQKRVERRILELADDNGKRLGLSRRQFMQTGCGMAAAFLAMNEVYGGNVFQVASAEAREPEVTQARAQSLSGQFIFDVQTHFVRDDFDHKELLGLAQFAAQHWNPALKGDDTSLVRYKFQNYVKEVYYDSDTNIALLSGAPFDDPSWWLLSNEQIVRAREVINDFAGSRRLLAHTVITPKQPGWMEEVDKAISVYKPDSWKSYTIGDPLAPSKFPWRLDDEQVMYPSYEKAVKAGINIICIHKGLLPADAGRLREGVRGRVGVCDRLGHRQGRQGLAADDVRRLPLCLARISRAAGSGLDRVRADRPHQMGDRSCRDPAKVRGQQRLCRARHLVRQFGRGASECRCTVGSCGLQCTTAP